MALIKKVIGRIHLWLGLTSGVLVLFLGITGCILAFQREIENTFQDYRYVEIQDKPFLLPTELKAIAVQHLPGKLPHSVTYGAKDDAAKVTFYHASPEYYYIVYVNPYTGAVQKVKDMDQDFFRIMILGHFYLWLPPAIGQPIVASATLVFVIMLISGIILWWPRNKAARKQRFTVKWNARWRRVNYDLHNVLGFYISWVIIFIALTGLVFGFQWFAKSVYWTASGGKSMVEYYEPHSAKKNREATASIPAVDQVWHKMNALYPAAETIEVHYPEHDSAAVAAGANPDKGTYWQIDYRYFDQYTLREMNVSHLYGRFTTATVADKIMRMNYDVHTGAVLGLPGKMLAFFASLIAASLPVTGFMIWRGRRKKKRAAAKKIPAAQSEPEEHIHQQPVPVSVDNA